MRRSAAAAISSMTLLVAVPNADAAATFTITGGGNGHGIGMSQYGAYGYALHGKDYRFILAHYYHGTALGTTNPKQTVRVLLSTARAPSFSGATRAGGHKLKATATYSVRALADGSLALYDQGGKQLARFASTVRVTGPAPLELVGSGAYRGALEFTASGGAVQTVNAIGLDDYVRGVVASEMPSSWSPAALEAQAVAARTYAVTANVGGNGYQLYSDTRSQAYGGVAAEAASSDAAVAATRGQIVTYHGVPATTYYFSSSGGYTENIENVWLGSTPEPWLHGVADPYDGAGGDPYHRWSYSLTMGDATRDLGSLVKGALVGIQVVKRGVSPRVVSAEVVGTTGHASVSGPRLESIFNLPSTYMEFSSITAAPGPPFTSGGASPQRFSLKAVEASIASLYAARREFHGTVFPARSGAVVGVQLRTRNGWRAVSHAALGSGGSFLAHVTRAGRYRIVYRGVTGPAVAVG